MILDLSAGKINELDKYNLEKITELVITFNNLKNIDKIINKCINLQKLNCSFNNLTSLPAELLHSLQILNCSCNQLTSLPTELPHSLQSLDCSNNQLTSLPAELPHSLQELHCDGNKLTSLPISIINCRRLRHISYSS